MCQVAFAGMTISLQLDKTEFTTSEEVELQVVVEGTEGLASPPEILNRHNFQIQDQGSSSQISIINGVTTVRKVFSYALYGLKEGQFTLGPAKAVANGVSIVSEPVQVTVRKGGGSLPPNQQKSGPGVNQGANPGPDVDGSNERNNGFYVEGVVDNQTPYLGQQIVYTFRFLRRVQIANGQLSLPEFTSFIKEPMGEQKEYDKQINGQVWRVTEIQVALYPTTVGTTLLQPATLITEVIVREPRGGGGPGGLLGRMFDEDPFFGGGMGRSKRMRLQSNPLTNTDKNLPEQ
jgi:hypothetical protein